MAEVNDWHPCPGGGYDRDLFGPLWAEVTQRPPQPGEAAYDVDPAAWSWKVRRLDGEKTLDVAQGQAPGHNEAMQAADEWWAASGLEAQYATLWNVALPVVAVLRGPTGEAAAARLAKALTAAGFDICDGGGLDAGSVKPFESEQGTEETDPPPNGWPW
jgi:hypothetical protein